MGHKPIARKSWVPAGPLAPLPTPRAIHAAIDQSIAQIEQDMGGRKRLIEVLSYNPSTTQLTSFLGSLADPRNAHTSLATLCRDHGYTIGDLLRAFQAALRLYAQTLSVKTITEHQPKVVEDVMLRALPYEEACVPCEGTGTLTEYDAAKKESIIKCKFCRGTGKVTVIPDLERQKVALDLAEMLPKKGGIQIGIANQQFHGSGATSGGTLERLQHAVSGVLYAEDSAIDAEVVPPDAPEP